LGGRKSAEQGDRCACSPHAEEVELELTKFRNPQLVEIEPAPPNTLGLRSVMFTVESPWVDRINGLEGVQVDIVMMRTPDGRLAFERHVERCEKSDGGWKVVDDDADVVQSFSRHLPGLWIQALGRTVRTPRFKNAADLRFLGTILNQERRD
jgi:hypothetical protein